MSPLGALAHHALDVPRDIGHEFMESYRANKADIADTSNPAEDIPLVGGVSQRGLKIAGNFLGEASAPVTGLAKALIGRPFATLANPAIKAATGGRYEADPEKIGDVASMAIPFADEAVTEARIAKTMRELGVSRTAATAMLKTKPAGALTEHQLRAERLQSKGVELTPGQKAGGALKRREDVHATSPYVGEAIRTARRKSIDSFNRAVYDHVLQALGVNGRYAGPVGHEGMQHLYSQIDAAYGKALLDPNVRAVKDGNWAGELGALRRKVPKSMLENFDHQVAKLWIDTPGQMDGTMFKRRESDFRKVARDYETSGVGSERELGRYLSEAGRYFRDTVERNSPPGTRAALRRADDGYAILRRVEGAATHRTTLAGGRGAAEGRFAPGDLLHAIKSQDDTLHHRALAKGDAVLQRFAQDAQTVLPNEVADSGTPERMKTGLAGRVAGILGGGFLGHQLGLGQMGAEAGGALGYTAGEPIDRAISAGTNALKRRQLEHAARSAVAPRQSVLNQALRHRKLAESAVAAGAANDEAR